MDLNGKVAVVSGAGSGIGRGLAVQAAARGAQVAVLDIDLAGAQATAARLAETGATARAYQVDVTDLPALEAVAEAVERDFGRINLTFNNAGVYVFGPLTKTRPEDFAWVFDVNVRGLFNAVRAFLPALERTVAAGDLAHIINTGSENALGMSDGGAFTAYTATKHAVLGLCDGLRRDLAGSGIGVSIICPGLVRTGLWNAKRTRHERFGGARLAPPEIEASMAAGRSPEATAETVFAGLDAGEFMIITDPRMRPFIDRRLAEVAQALDVADVRITTL